MNRDTCDGCGRLFHLNDLYPRWKLTARQTFSSPAEYDDVLICEACLSADERDEDYERAEQSEEWQARGGGGL